MIQLKIIEFIVSNSEEIEIEGYNKVEINKKKGKYYYRDDSLGVDKFITTIRRSKIAFSLEDFDEKEEMITKIYREDKLFASLYDGEYNPKSCFALTVDLFYHGKEFGIGTIRLRTMYNQGNVELNVNVQKEKIVFGAKYGRVTILVHKSFISEFYSKCEYPLATLVPTYHLLFSYIVMMRIILRESFRHLSKLPIYDALVYEIAIGLRERAKLENPFLNPQIFKYDE